MFCQFCGNKLPDNSSKCPACGSEVNSYRHAPSSQHKKGGHFAKKKQKHNTMRNILLILLILSVILSTAAILIALRTQKAPQAQETLTSSTAIESTVTTVPPTFQEATTEPPAPPTQPPDLKEYMDCTADEILLDIKKNAQNAIKQYQDQYVAITGTLLDINRDESWFSLGAIEHHTSKSIICTLYSKEQLDILTAQNIGDIVTIQCKVSDVANYRVDTIAIFDGQEVIPYEIRIGSVLRSSGGLKIRSGPGTSYDEVGRLSPGESVTIYDETITDGTPWGQIDGGWVCMDYIVFGQDTSAEPLIGSVLRSSGGLKIRNGPGTSYDEVGRLAPGDSVAIYEQQDVNGTPWGKTDRGWVCMDYIVFGEDHSAEPEYTQYPEPEQNPDQPQENPPSNTQQFSNDAVIEKTFNAFRSKIRSKYSGPEILYHSASYSDAYVTFDAGTGKYTCSMTATYNTNIFDIFGTSTSTYFVNAELADSNGNLVITHINIS